MRKVFDDVPGHMPESEVLESGTIESGQVQYIGMGAVHRDGCSTNGRVQVQSE